ncbi:hypothetical protein F2Q70_00016899, partial [Brassica cretica]
MATESKTKAGLGVRLDDEYKTSMEAEIRLRRISYLPDEAKEAEKETCVICLDEDIGSDVMFAVDKCGHRFCRHYVKQHIEVKLLDGTFPSCLQHRCKSQLTIDRCDKLLTLKLSLMWKQRIREDSTPFTERVYCPQGRLTSRASGVLSTTCFESSGFRTCFKCSGSFCVNCKVPWHYRLSCSDYEKSCTARYADDARLKSLASGYRWRQYGKGQQMIERFVGCGRIKC